MDKDELRKRLTNQQWRVTQEAATDPAYRNEFDQHFDVGRYHCICCGQKLFTSEAKYNSGCGWPAFSEPLGGVAEKADASHGMTRTEVVCEHCGAHLGHVFPDGLPERGGQRYCINSSSLEFKPE